MRQIVFPGQFLTDKRKRLGSNVFLESNKVYSSVLGLLSESEDYISIIALKGPYVPCVGDGVVGIISSEVSNGYIIDINYIAESFFPKSLLTKKLNIGDVIFARVSSVDDGVSLDNINILPKGYIVNVPSVKVPRLIGKNESMLNIIKQYTNSNIVIGKNGVVWYLSKKAELLEKVIDLIVRNSQKAHLTNYVQEYLKKNTN